MKNLHNLLLTLFAALTATATLVAQVTIDQSDMPEPGDTIRVSLTNNVPPGFQATGMDTVWNFLALEPLSQRIDTFVTATATPPLYQVFFVLSGGANLASPRASLPIPGIPVSQGFAFFRNGADSYSELGTAYTVQGLPLPAKYDVPDKLYQFPLTPGSTWGSVSTFAITIPDLVSYSTRRTRTSTADGWGTLITPFGTHQTVRVRSDLVQYDSLYIDSLGVGFPIVRNITEYKWLADGQGIPLLQVTEEGSLATAVYRDIPRLSALPLSVNLGPDTAVQKGTNLTLRARLSGGTPPYQVLWSTLDTGETLQVTVMEPETYSVIVLDALQNFAFDEKSISIIYPPGFSEKSNGHMTIFPNPSRGGSFVLGTEIADEKVSLEILTTDGKILYQGIHRLDKGRTKVDPGNLPDGMYVLRLRSSTTVLIEKLVISR